MLFAGCNEFALRAVICRVCFMLMSLKYKVRNFTPRSDIRRQTVFSGMSIVDGGRKTVWWKSTVMYNEVQDSDDI